MDRTNLITKLKPWIEDPPDFFIVADEFKALGAIKAQIIQKKREIERVEDGVSIESDKPRSNEAKQQKLKSTITLKDELADLEAQHAVLELSVKRLEYRKTMFNASSYALKMALDL